MLPASHVSKRIFLRFPTSTSRKALYYKPIPFLDTQRTLLQSGAQIILLESIERSPVLALSSRPYAVSTFSFPCLGLATHLETSFYCTVSPLLLSFLLRTVRHTIFLFSSFPSSIAFSIAVFTGTLICFLFVCTAHFTEQLYLSGGFCQSELLSELSR